MKINQSIFKSYDIRGIYPEMLNEDVIYRAVQAFISYLSPPKIIIGRDGRLSSLSLYKTAIKSALDKGVRVYVLGEVPTECLSFAIGYYKDYDAGIVITASHNSKEYNGLKMVTKENSAIRLISGEKIGSLIREAGFSYFSNDIVSDEELKQVEVLDVWEDYLSHILSFVETEKIKPFKIVVDASNGVAAKGILKIAEELPIKIIPLNFNIDGNFPAHPPNPLEKGAMAEISKKIKEEGADFGFIFDGDADRIFLLDELGNFSADAPILILAKYFLEKNPGSGIAYNIALSKAVPEFIKKWGGRPIRTPVGFVNVQKGMFENNGIMGGESSGHYSFKDNFYADSGLMAFLIFLEVISSQDKKVSEIISDLIPYYKEEINFEVGDKEKVLKAVQEKYADAKQDFLDGVTIEYENWWFNLRSSQTEPLLRLTIEAEDKNLFEKVKKELAEFILSNSK